jgi:antitoxin (DNA-binding transcriptional repressor) of toxin-antitoxin stability system
MKTKRVNLADAKAHLSEYARRVRKGERFILCDRNRPFAELRPITDLPQGRRPIGLGKGIFSMGSDFNDPDPEMEKLFGLGR